MLFLESIIKANLSYFSVYRICFLSVNHTRLSELNHMNALINLTQLQVGRLIRVYKSLSRIFNKPNEPFEINYFKEIMLHH